MNKSLDLNDLSRRTFTEPFALFGFLLMKYMDMPSKMFFH